MRASDEDRNRVVAALRRATTDGYLTLDEFEERLDGVFRSRYLTELDALLQDIPGAPRPSRWQAGPPPAGGAWQEVPPRPVGGWRPGPAGPAGPPGAPVWAPQWGAVAPFHAAVRLMLGLLVVALVMSVVAHIWFPPLPLVFFGFLYWRRCQRRHHTTDAV